MLSWAKHHFFASGATLQKLGQKCWNCNKISSSC